MREAHPNFVSGSSWKEMWTCERINKKKLQDWFGHVLVIFRPSRERSSSASGLCYSPFISVLPSGEPWLL